MSFSNYSLKGDVKEMHAYYKQIWHLQNPSYKGQIKQECIICFVKCYYGISLNVKILH